MVTKTPKKVHPLWILVGALAVVGAAWIVFDAASDKGVETKYKIALPVMFVGCLWIFWKIQHNLPKRLDSWTEWQKPKTAASVLFVVVSSLSVIGGIVQLVAPRAATESKGGLIEATTNQTLATVDEVKDGLAQKGIIAGQPSMVEQHIDGVWGQSDCVNTYLFTLDPAGGTTRILKVISVDSDKDLDPYSGEFVFKAAVDEFGGSDGFQTSTLSTQEVEGFHPGYAVDFTLRRAGSSETLLWSNKNDEQADPTLIRCPDKGTKS
jgi:hypothetical protein